MNKRRSMKKKKKEKRINGWYKDKFGLVHIQEYSLKEFSNALMKGEKHE